MNKNHLPKLLGALIFVLLGVGFLSLPQKFALAASCSGNGCNGTDPHDTGCDADARTITTYFNSTVKVELRESKICITLWNRLTNLASGYRYPRATLRKASVIKTYRNTTYTIGPNATIWTFQYYQPGGLPIDSDWNSCGLVSTTYSPSPVTNPCTPWWPIQ